MIDNLGASGRLVVGYARQVAANLNCESVGIDHLFLGIGDLEDLAIRRALLDVGIDLDEACLRVRREITPGAAGSGRELPLDAGADAALHRAQAVAMQFGAKEVEAPHILIGILGDDDALPTRVARDLGADPRDGAGADQSDARIG
jgi:ATP-dependent Clp protease ATP-binding subunit ClpA